MTPVCNSTPLIHLWRIDRLDLLRQVLGRILVPPAVLEEVRPHLAEALEAALLDRWLVSTAPADGARVAGLEQRLGGRGEAEVIALALEQPDGLVLIDERAARRACRELGLITRGTLGLLVDAKQSGFLDAVRPAVDALRSTGFWLDDALTRRLLELAGEI